MHLLSAFLWSLVLAPLASPLPSSQGDATLGSLQSLDIPIDDTIPIPSDLLSEKILGEIVTYLHAHPKVDTSFPGLRQVLQLVKGGKVDRESYSRELLKSIQIHPKFREAFGALDKDLQDKLTGFMGGASAESIVKKRGFSIPPSPAAKEHFKRMEESGVSPSSRGWLNSKRETSPVIYEDGVNTKPMTVNAHLLKYWEGTS